MTGRYAYRSGTLTVADRQSGVGDLSVQGMVQWEVTIANLLSDLGIQDCSFR